MSPDRKEPRRDGRARIGDGTLAFTTAGTGEPLLLIHGLGGSRRTWDHIIDDLATRYTVIAPDLPGHGESDAPAGDYSLGALAASLRDLLVVLGHPTATVIGHSLGGGVALQFAYQFPERIERLVLISSGGLGPQLTPMLRAATLPGAATVVAGLARMPQSVTRRAADLLTDPQLLEIGGAGHYPHETAAEQLLPELHRFLETTTPFRYAEARWRHMLTAPRPRGGDEVPCGSGPGLRW